MLHALVAMFSAIVTTGHLPSFEMVEFRVKAMQSSNCCVAKEDAGLLRILGGSNHCFLLVVSTCVHLM